MAVKFSYALTPTENVDRCGFVSCNMSTWKYPEREVVRLLVKTRSLHQGGIPSALGFLLFMQGFPA